MTDENALLRATDRAVKAQHLVDNEMLKEAFDGLETSYIAAWRGTTIEDVAGREKLFLAINVIGKVREHLESYLRDGKLAAAELKQLAELAERKKRFGIL